MIVIRNKKFRDFLVDNNLLRYTHTTAEGATEPSNDVMWLNNEAPGPMDATLVITAKTMVEMLKEGDHSGTTAEFMEEQLVEVGFFNTKDFDTSDDDHLKENAANLASSIMVQNFIDLLATMMRNNPT